jgi:hypothetical protein
MNGGYRMKKRNLIFRSTAAALCTGLIATLGACGGDDTTGEVYSGSSGGAGSSSGSGIEVGGSSSSSSGAAGGSSSGSGSGSGSSGGSVGSSSGSLDAGHESGSGTGADSGSDATADATAHDASDASDAAAHDASDGGEHDATVGDATTADSGGGDSTTDASDAAADAGRTQLEWCLWLDYTFGASTSSPDSGADAGICATQTPASGTCPDRAGTWANNFTGIAGDFLNLVYADCRVEAMASIPVLTSGEVDDYANQATIWTLAFFGCPDLSQPLGPFNGFGLIPQPLIGHAFTTADVQLLEDMYVAGINQALSDNGATPPALTADQTNQVRASLESWASSVSPVTSPTYSYSDPSTCASDGGPIGEAGPDGGSDTDAEGDGGTSERSTDAGGG